MSKNILMSGNIEEEYYRYQDKMNVELIFLFGLFVSAFFPFLLPLPFLILYIWHRDIHDLSGDWKRKIDKQRMYVLPSLLISFFAFYFLVFPYLPENPFPIWSVYPHISPHLPIWLNATLFAILSGITAFGMYKLKGYCKVECHPWKKYIGKDVLFLPTQTHGTLVLDKINTGIMVIGSPGGGKTELIQQFMSQLPDDKDYAWVIFDPKGDYMKEFAKEGDIILSVEGGTHAWNIFWEVPLDTEDPDLIQKIDADIHEIASGLLSEDAWQQDKFWIQTARELLYAVIYVKVKEAIETYWSYKEIYRKSVEEAKKEGKEPPPKPEELKDIRKLLPSNYDLAKYLRTTPMQEMYDDLSKHEKLVAIAEYVNPQAEKMAMSIKATLSSEVEKIFIGSFGSMKSGELPQMSIREYIENPNGRKLFILYDVHKGKVLGNIYKVLIERAIQFAIANENKYTPDGRWKRKYFIVDEFQNIPPVSNYQTLVNLGRTLGCTSIIGIQSLAQVDEKYKAEGTNSMVAGHGIVISFRDYDKRSTEFIMDRLGKREAWTERPVQEASPRGGSATIGREIQRIEYYPIAEGELRYYESGRALLITHDGWKKIKIYPYKPLYKSITKGVGKFKKEVDVKTEEGAIKYIQMARKELWKLEMHDKLVRKMIREREKMKKKISEIQKQTSKKLSELEAEHRKIIKQKEAPASKEKEDKPKDDAKRSSQSEEQTSS